MAPLTAFNPALGPSLSQCHPEPVTLHMKEKAFSLSGEDFTVKTVGGVEVCKCKGKLLSLSDKKGQWFPVPSVLRPRVGVERPRKGKERA